MTILRLVAKRQRSPLSILSKVRGEMPAKRASSALLNIFASRIFLTLFFASIRTRIPPHSKRRPL
jgi:hypothetical protein